MTAGALSCGIFSFRNWAKTSADAPVTRIPTICNGCGNRCALFAFVKNKRIWKIEGNKEANGNRGLVCPRGHGYIHDVYNPNRIRTPLKRTNPRKGRGEDPGWEPISWDAALDLLATKLRAIRAAGLVDAAGYPRLAATFGSGGIGGPMKLPKLLPPAYICRFKTCTLTKWKCMGCTSPVLL